MKNIKFSSIDKMQILKKKKKSINKYMYSAVSKTVNANKDQLNVLLSCLTG